MSISVPALRKLEPGGSSKGSIAQVPELRSICSVIMRSEETKIKILQIENLIEYID